MARVPLVQDVLGWTALHWAASSGHVDAAKALLAAGANVTAATVRGAVACAGAGTGSFAVVSWSVVGSCWRGYYVWFAWWWYRMY